MSNRITYTSGIHGLLGESGNSSPIALQSPVYEGIITDIILDKFHPKYSKIDGYTLGMAKVRIFDKSDVTNSDSLDWALPMDTSICQFPLIGELVILFKIRSILFYTSKLPIAGRIQENALINLDRALENRFTNTLSKAIRTNTEISLSSHKFGKYFIPDSRVRQLMHFEGDTIIQGRMGHSIRMGSSRMDNGKKFAPNLILRAGQAKDVEKNNISIDSQFGYILEDVNKDASSIWMVSDQNIPFSPATKNAGSIGRSLASPPLIYSGASITINSDRLVLNSKDTHILLYSNDEIYLNSFKRTSIDTDDSILLTANLDIVSRSSRNIEFRADKDYVVSVGGRAISNVVESISFLSNKIFIGSTADEAEPMVGGKSLSIFLARLIMILMGVPSNSGRQTQQDSRISLSPLVPGIASTSHVITPAGPGLLNPLIQKELIKLYNELFTNNFKSSPFNSEDNFVNLQNEVAELVLNDFKQGESSLVENNEWKLGEEYYRVT
jgi:hypothetical protein